MESVSNKYDVLGFIPFVGTVSGIVGLVKETKKYNNIKETNKKTSEAFAVFGEEEPLRISPKYSKDRIVRRSFEIVPILGPIVWTIGWVGNKIFSAINGSKKAPKLDDDDTPLERKPVVPPRRESLQQNVDILPNGTPVPPPRRQTQLMGKPPTPPPRDPDYDAMPPPVAQE